MKTSLTLALLILAWPVTAQDPGADTLKSPEFDKSKKGGQTAAQSPADEVLEAARDRMNQQNDAWFHNGDYLPVIENEEMLVRLHPDDEETWSSLMWMYQNIDNSEMQWVTTRRFAIANPSYSDAHYYEAQFCFMKKMYAKVPALLEPSIARTPPPDNNAFRFLAHAYTKMGYFSDALRVWDAYIKINPNDAQAKVNRKRVADSLHKS